ncbi:MAG: carboxypeptidase M32 [Verrucomicrobia bacterium]|nr:carboxypeptidase M32 [Verrucomicrobiota bacterium]
MPDSYERLVAKLKRAHLLGTVSGLLAWDEQVNLPPDSIDQRSEQMALVAELQHAAAADPDIGALLAELEAQSLLSDIVSEEEARRVVVREARRDYDRLVRLPADFVAERARHVSLAYHAWVGARKAGDFAAFAPFLEKHLALARQEAELMGWGDRPYDYALDKHDPGMTAVTITVLFSELKTGLLPLVRAIEASPVKAPAGLFNDFPVEGQRTLLTEIATAMGFNFRRGRIDVSPHPFCEGCGADIRMTTRFDTDNPLDAIFSAIHETGHGLYEQGLPLAHLGTPLGQPVGMGVHESQSRLWENQVARSRAFWVRFEPRLRELFPGRLAGVSKEQLHLAMNAVEPTLIRTEADEIHYNLHVMLRFELERRLFAGELTVAGLPAAWNALSQELLGLTPPDDRLGVLQDVHWSGGAFGYFPSYCLGNMIAAQFWAVVGKVLPGLEADFEKGDFSRLLGWLRKNIHEQGRRYDTRALVRHVTGEELTPQYLLSYLRDRYAPLYLA